MKIVIVSGKTEKSFDIEKLIEAYKKVGIDTQSIDVVSLRLYVKNGIQKILYGKGPLKNFEGVFLQVEKNFVLFVEPFLDCLAEKGVYCQLKPSSFNLISNKSLLKVILISKDIPSRKTSLYSSINCIERVTDSFSYPILLEAFKGVEKIQRIIVESKASLNSFLKDNPFKFDVMSIQEYFEENKEESIVIGEDIITIQKKWIDEKKDFSRKWISIKLKDDEKKEILKAVRIVGLDIAMVTTSRGKILDIDSKIDFEKFNQETGEDVYLKVANFYKRRLKDEENKI